MDQGGQTYEFEQYADYSVLVLKPAMNDAQWGQIEKAGDEVLQKIESIKTPHLIADLSELDYIGSAMVALVVRIWKIVKAKNARMVVVNRNPMVLEVFKISKLDEVWTIVEYREDALYELGVSPEAKTERRESNLLVFVSVIVTLIGAAGLGLYAADPDLLGLRLAQILAFGCSGLGVILGLVLLFKEIGGRRAIGVGTAIAALAIFWGAVFTVPFNLEAQPDAKPAADDREESGKTRESDDVTESDVEPEASSQTKSPRPAVAEKPDSPED